MVDILYRTMDLPDDVCVGNALLSGCIFDPVQKDPQDSIGTGVEKCGVSKAT